MQSFYGGPSGQSFTITQVFTTKNGISNSLVSDVTLGWSSLIPIGSYVVVAYGLPNDPMYNTYKQVDLDKEKKSYNFTLWQKYYDESFDTSPNGIGYRLIGSLTGNVPVISVKTVILDADGNPDISIDNSDIDLPVITFSIPRSQVILSANVQDHVLDADQQPRVEFDSDGDKINEPTIDFYIPQSQVILSENVHHHTIDANKEPYLTFDVTDEKVNRPVVDFYLPQSQRLVNEKVNDHVLNADEDPRVEFDSNGDKINEPTLDFYIPQAQRIIPENVHTYDVDADESSRVEFNVDGENINKPVLNFYIPQAQRFIADNVQGHVLNANEQPYIEFDDADVKINEPTLDFYLPQSQYIEKVEVEEVLDADQNPDVRLDATEDVNRPVLKFKLPVAQQFISENVTAVPIDADKDPDVHLGGAVNKPTLTFDLPKSQVLKEGNVTSKMIDANAEPSIEFTAEPGTTTINEPKLQFNLPRSQIFGVKPAKVLDPAEAPGVQLDDSQINTPQIEFSLPRAIKFYYGNRLGKKNDITDTDPSYVEYGIGDYYINASTGFIYEIRDVQGSTITVSYVACLERPLPEVTTEDINPYKEDGTPNPPVVEKSYLDEDETTWNLDFKLPRTPKAAITTSFVASVEEGTADVAPENGDTLRFTFSIPKGTRLFNGIEAPSAIDEAKEGDYYLDTVTGNFYRYTDSDWVQEEGSLRGPIGKALNVVADYRVDVGSLIPGEETPTTGSLDDGTKYIQSQQGPEKVYTPEELFAITWVNPDGTEVSYWQYYISEGVWGRVSITGDISRLLINEYTSVEEHKIYTTTYINGLITSNDSDKELTTYPKSKIEEMLSWGNLADLTE